MDNEPNMTEETQQEPSSKIIKRAEQAAVYRTPVTETVCVRCAAEPRAEGSEYCEHCIAALKKNRPHVSACFAFAAAVIVTVLAFCLCYLNFSPAKRVLEARTAMKESRLNDSLAAYEDSFSVASELNSVLNQPLAEKVPEGVGIIMTGSGVRGEEADVVARLYGDYYSGNFIMNFFDEKTIAADPKMAAYKKAFEEYDKAEKLAQEYLAGCEEGTIDPKEALAKIKELENGNEDVLMWIIYFESYVDTVFLGGGDATQLAYVERIQKQFPEKSWFFNPLLREAYYSLGRYEESEKYCDLEIKDNLNSVEPVMTKLRIAMLADDKEKAESVIKTFEKNNEGSIDIEAMKIMMARRFEGVDEAIKLYEDLGVEAASDPELTRQNALNLLAKGEYDAAYDACYDAYMSAYNYYYNGYSEAMTNELIESVYLCATMCKLHGDGSAESIADLDALLADFLGFEKEAKKTTMAIINGETTAAEVLTKGACDLV